MGQFQPMCVLNEEDSGVDKVLCDLCSCLTKTGASGCGGTHFLRSIFGLARKAHSSLRNILCLFSWLSSILGGCGTWPSFYVLFLCRYTGNQGKMRIP